MTWSFRKKSKTPKAPAQPAGPKSNNDEKQAAVGRESRPSPSLQYKSPEPVPQAAQPVQPQPTQAAPKPPAPVQPTPVAAPSEGIDTPKLDLSTNEEVNAIWLQVQERVRMLAASEGKVVNAGLEIDDVIANLESSQEKEEESPTREAVKVAFGRTMGLIKTVGGIVVDGASTVFAPAGQCYNAISFLINAYDGYQGAFDGLAELLERCSDHLGRLDYYIKGGMDTRLSKVAAQQLLLFVEICDAALKLRSSAREKIKTGLKIAFLAENSIQGLLGEMAKLAERERGLVSAQTFQLASAAASSAAEGAASNKQLLNVLAGNSAEQKQLAENEGQQKTLMDVLAFDQDPDRWDSKKEQPVETWQRRYNEIRKDVVPDTGKWLLSGSAFQSWISDSSCSPILGVEGIDISGKTYLTSSVVKYLRTDVIAQCPEFRHLVAFFFLDREQPGQGTDAMAKSLVWQLAAKDRPYMKSAARISGQARALDPDDILHRLLLENTELEQMGAIFYLIIDGLGDVLDASLLRFLQGVCESRDKRIRVFLTGTSRAFEQMQKSGLHCNTIEINRSNGDDIKKFIESRMDKFDALADTERPGVLEQRNEIRDGLFQAVNGDYYKLNAALNMISTLDYMDDIKRVIQGAHDDRSKQLHDEIDMLNRKFSLRQIQEINQIILWTTFALDPVTEELASEALYMITGETSLRPLAEQIRTKYLLFEVNRKRHVGFRSPKALDVIPHRHQLAKSDGQDGQAIQSGEIDIVLHFLDNVCPPALYRKLELREYLQNKLIQKQEQIQQEDQDTGHLRLALDCLRVFRHGRDERVTVLQKYSRKNCIHHLAEVDLAMVDRDQKGHAGELLLWLFTTNEGIDAFINTGDLDDYFTQRFGWFMGSRHVDHVVRWFRDTAVVSRVAEPGRTWIQSVVADNSLNTLLSPSVTRMAHHCFKEKTSIATAKGIFYFISDFLDQINQEKLENSAEKITRFEKWAHEALDFVEKDAIWHTQMAMIYEHLSSLKQEVIDRCELALQLDPGNWRASYYKAKASPPSEAIQMLRALISRLEKDSASMDGPSRLDDITGLQYELAKQYWKTKQYDLAKPLYAECVQHAPARIGRAVAVFYQYRREREWAGISSLLGQLAEAEDGKHLGNMVLRESRDLHKLPFHETIWLTARETKQFGLVDTVFEAGIQRAEKMKDNDALVVLCTLYGVALGEQPGRNEDKVIRLWETALWEYFPSSDLEPSVVDFINGLLAPLYLQRALTAKANSDPDSVAYNLERLSNMLPEGIASSQLFLPPQLWSARFYHLNNDDAKARQIARSQVQVAMELLSDEDQSNDQEAFRSLRFILTALGDDRNALTALALEIREILLDAESTRFRMPSLCGGQCGRSWDVPSDLWICKTCINVYLESNCLAKLKEGKLGENKFDPFLTLFKIHDHDIDHLSTMHRENMCNPDHQFIKVPDWDEDFFDSLPQGTAPWGDQNITLDEWKEEIRKVYIDVDS